MQFIGRKCNPIAVPAQSAPTPDAKVDPPTHTFHNGRCIYCHSNETPTLGRHCIPPTSAPVGAAYNALMEEETKESLVRMVLTGFDEIADLKRQLAEAAERELFLRADLTAAKESK